MANSNATDRSVGGGELRFCPFCREGFEADVCPDHDLPLVAWVALPRARATLDPWAPLPWHSPGLGRGWLAFGAGLTCLAFLTGSLVSVDSDPPLDGRMLSLALRSAPKLWLVPAAALGQLSILLRRRTPVALHGARLAAVFLAAVPLLVSTWTWLGATDALALLAERTGQALAPRPGLGAYALGVGTLCALVGAARLGTCDPGE